MTFKNIKYVLIFLSIFFISNQSFAEITYVEIQAKGKAANYEDALKKALKVILKKTIFCGEICIASESIIKRKVPV